jgi:hypothetical protein
VRTFATIIEVTIIPAVVPHPVSVAVRHSFLRQDYIGLTHKIPGRHPSMVSSANFGSFGVLDLVELILRQTLRASSGIGEEIIDLLRSVSDRRPKCVNVVPGRSHLWIE